MKQINMNDIPLMTLSELENYLLTANHASQGRKMALEEYNRKKLDLISKPHWSVIPSFVLLVMSLIVSCTALFISIY
ncbi:hypothetical protein AB1Z10_001858 [Vibrio parahaemolyticus]|uniref:Uncharacterized protein n=1 Tax=Vibrio diabolicus TaxID=50719 RepID=A0AAX1XRS5_9VIBR|nr:MULTISPECIES: hypothetical protein [Vibrio harveyi group]EHZ2782530.1 hypothetical protein [Vibrio parahaemolyticus]MBM5090348.1 hypothetical protein [Vibrio parahaemolyticus]MBM5182462.1 hypothetical protein [Vibrio parahaemolyticus]OEA92454.1 hypothetical protein BBN03_02160 [Vibrio parahaemolyticus]RPB42012.1 hypothetical protein CYQ91_06730 [Vibrio diabolicus]